MGIPGTPVAPGRARGRVHLVDLGGRWIDLSVENPVPVVPSELWPPEPAELPRMMAILVEGRLPPRTPPPPIPVVAGVDRDLFREGERVTVDGNGGEVEIEGVSEQKVVTAFVVNPSGKVLLLRRSERVGSFRGRWAAISGYLEGSDPLQQAYREIREETGLERGALTLVQTGSVVVARDGSTAYLVHPFLFRTAQSSIRLDWEHTEADWADPDQILARQTVPKLDRAWAAVARPSLQNDNSAARPSGPEGW